MSSASTLTDREIRLIRGMLSLDPIPSNQAILAHFSRPGRDLNHRVIAEIKSGSRRPDLTPASRAETVAFMIAARQGLWPDPEHYVENETLAWLGLAYWPVGQGLFSTGTVLRRGSPPLTWVYDCGTTSEDTLLSAALKTYSEFGRRIGQNSIRLAVLSHFDKDHISGIVRLSKAHRIRTLMLPYISIWLRIAIALEENIGANDPLFAFFIDPAAYLLGAGGDIEEFLFVSSSGPEDPPPDAPDEPEIPPEEGGDTLKIEYDHPPAEATNDPMLTAGEASRIRFLRKSSRLVAPFLWEFLPYNDADLAPCATPAFAATVAPIIAQFTGAKGGTDELLKQIKALYDAEFGNSPKSRNVISLFMYSGPLGRQAKVGRVQTSEPVDRKRLSRGFSQMYTGDGYLNSGSRLDTFRRFFSAGARLDRCGLLQVMHHGAEGNWHKGVAEALSPAISLFSSDPDHASYGHPHAKVLRDFWKYQPVQVDDDQCFCLWAELQYGP